MTTLRKLAEAATPGPWTATVGTWDGSISHASGHLLLCKARDAEYIAALSPERVLRMLAVIEAAKAMRRHAPTIKQQQAFDAALAALESDQ